MRPTSILNPADPLKVWIVDPANLTPFYSLALGAALAKAGDQVRFVTSPFQYDAELAIPAGIQSGEMLRMKGLGLPELNGTLRGDQFVRVVVWTPDELTPEQEALMRKLRAIETPAPAEVQLRTGQKGFWSRVKEAFTGG